MKFGRPSSVSLVNEDLSASLCCMMRLLNFWITVCPLAFRILIRKGWFVWVLWHINLCRLFNAKSIFMKIVLFQTIQFSISTQLDVSTV